MKDLSGPGDPKPGNPIIDAFKKIISWPYASPGEAMEKGFLGMRKQDMMLSSLIPGGGAAAAALSSGRVEKAALSELAAHWGLPKAEVPVGQIPWEGEPWGGMKFADKPVTEVWHGDQIASLNPESSPIVDAMMAKAKAVNAVAGKTGRSVKIPDDVMGFAYDHMPDIDLTYNMKDELADHFAQGPLDAWFSDLDLKAYAKELNHKSFKASKSTVPHHYVERN